MKAKTWNVLQAVGKSLCYLLPDSDDPDVRKQASTTVDTNLVELCVKCRKILERLPGAGSQQDFRHWDNLSKLAISVARGCHICKLFKHGIRESYPGSSFFGDPFPPIYRKKGMVRAAKRRMPSDNLDDSHNSLKGEEDVGKWTAVWDLNLYLPDSTLNPEDMIFSFVVLRPAEELGTAVISLTDPIKYTLTHGQILLPLELSQGQITRHSACYEPGLNYATKRTRTANHK